MKTYRKGRARELRGQWFFIAWAALVIILCAGHLWLNKAAGIVSGQ